MNGQNICGYTHPLLSLVLYLSNRDTVNDTLIGYQKTEMVTDRRLADSFWPSTCQALALPSTKPLFSPYHSGRVLNAALEVDGRRCSFPMEDTLYMARLLIAPAHSYIYRHHPLLGSATSYPLPSSTSLSRHWAKRHRTHTRHGGIISLSQITRTARSRKQHDGLLRMPANAATQTAAQAGRTF